MNVENDAPVDGPERGREPEGKTQRDRFEKVLDHIREGFQIIGFDWRYLYVNGAVCRQGRQRRDELVGRTMMDVYPGIEKTEMFAALERVMRERVPVEMDNEFVFPDGSRAWFELRIEPVPDGILILSLDIDRRKSLETQLYHAQKMEAIGRLAGGIAHDFNNILTAIQSFGQFALERLDEGGPAHDDVTGVLEAAGRAEKLVRQLLAFSRKQRIEPKVLDVNELVGSLDAMLQRVLGEDVGLITRQGPSLWNVLVDPGAFEQVLVNLAVNARDAMPEGGKLTIQTENAVLDENYAMAKGDLVKPGDYVAIAVSDNGTGLAREASAHLFEPFFTTKERGRGTGLGLSTCYGIVKQAGGYIWVYSEPGKGTTFKIYLPRAERTSENVVRPESSSSTRSLEGDETILLVEDEAQVRRLAVRVLERYGYRVIPAENGDEAERLYDEVEKTKTQAIDLLLTDVIMPEVSGRSLADSLRRRRRGLRVLYMSGYTEDAIVHHGVLERGIQLVEKPFTPERLARKVREVLDAE